jgi:hypothetical protein
MLTSTPHLDNAPGNVETDLDDDRGMMTLREALGFITAVIVAWIVFGLLFSVLAWFGIGVTLYQDLTRILLLR